MKKTYLFVIVLCLLIISASVYYILGGFEELQVYESEATSRTVIGKHHIGRFPQRRINEFLKESRVLIDSGKLKGKLTLVEYQNDTIGKDSSHLFIGASFDETRDILQIPSGFTYKEYQSKKVYQVYITQHQLVRPTPSQVRVKVEDQINNTSEVLQPYSFEIYYDDWSLLAEFWTQ